MFAAAVRVLARAATIQLEEAASAHPRAPSSLLKGKQRAAPIRDLRHDRAVPETDLDIGTSGSATTRGSPIESSRVERVSTTRDQSGKRSQDQFATITSELGDEPVNTSADLPGPSRPRRELILESSPAATVADASEASDPPSTTPTTNHTAPPSVAAAGAAAAEPSDPIAAERPLSKVKTAAHSKPQTGDVKAGSKLSEASAPSITPDELPQEPREEVIPNMSEAPEGLAEEQEESQVMLRASKVPSSRIGRLFHYGSLAASMGWGAASEGLRRSTGGAPSGGSVFMSDANIRRLVSTLGRMRGAALKLGQFMSIQDNHMLPPEIEKVLQQVQAHANYMPDWQMEKVMSTEFGTDWQKMFSSFDRVPIASASIGQVHKATMADTGLPVAVKIQFPGIASSITSDLSNLSILLRSSALLPKGLYLQNTIAVMKRELEDECDYIREAESGRRFSELLKGYDYFKVPTVVDQASTSKVLTVEWMEGKPLSRIKGLSQEARDQIGENVLRLCLLELFKFRFMQTDPNWANFLYDTKAHKLGLIDFGASREYTKEFMDGWYRLLTSALKGDRETMKLESENLGYLTGEENEMMVKAHLDSMALVASPFHHTGPYAFAQQTITSSVRSLIPIMLAHRLTPPPQETYSLNRKLSGAFLMCAKLESRVDCAKLWEEVVGDYKQGPE